MNKWCLKSGLAALLGGVTLMAWAANPVAVLQQPQGKVFISQGKAMVPAQPGIAVYPGNRVVTAASGGVSVVYTDGCKVILPENSLLVLGGPKQCEAGLARIRTIGSFQNARIGQGGSMAEKKVANIGDVKGVGSVGQVSVGPGMPLYKGDRVTARAGSKIVIKYDNGCEATVEANQSLVIGDPPVCEAALAAGGAGGAGGAAGAGVGALVIGGAGLILVGAAIASDNDHEDRADSIAR